MKVYLIQPYFGSSITDAEKSFNGLTSLLDKCGKDADVIVMPEYSDVPVSVTEDDVFFECVNRYNEKILKKAKETAKRCNAVVFINCAFKHEKGLRNTTYAINRSGKIVGKYFKYHLAPSELKKFDYSYKTKKYKPYTVTIDGIKYGFLTCYDFYFYEDYVYLARSKPDVIIGCSRQRTDTHEASLIFGKFLAYNTNAYLIRSSISLGEEKKVCGASMIIAPDGKTVVNMKSNIGIKKANINVKEKYLKPAGFNGKPSPHFEYVDKGR